MVWLVLANARQPFVTGFWVPFVLDFTVVAYTIGYFAFCGFSMPAREQPLQRR